MICKMAPDFLTFMYIRRQQHDLRPVFFWGYFVDRRIERFEFHSWFFSSVTLGITPQHDKKRSYRHLSVMRRDKWEPMEKLRNMGEVE